MEKNVIHKFCEKVKDYSFSIDYWDGSSENYGQGAPAFKVIFKDKISVMKMLKDPSLALGEAYMDGIIDFKGNLEQIVETAYKIKIPFFEKKGFHGLQKFFARENKSTSLIKQRKDIEHHYDLGNDFYELWLDETMSYSCAYFCSPEDSLYQAQLQKIDYILKKLQLKSGETLLDIGCGWGWLIIRAAQQYGVKALGITLSEEQYTKTKQRIAELGLTEQVDVKLMDYRKLAESDGYKFNKVVSVGMVEHVGKANLPKYMEAVEKLLVPGGISVLHCITGQIEGPCNRWISKYIFPGGYIPSIRELIYLLPENDFHLLDAESLRLHYAKTLDHWSKNFENKIEQVREKYDERFIKMWRLYLNSCAASFCASGLDIHQIIFSKGINNKLPMTRNYLYS
ncbi:cyclopropane-fatty-acyl-phospholipid synthase [Clostridium homopropionicum DSM 5847]|uniref:Cyclopropane-fatty-acyl-phospholipid synthase n=1 Tax=Clostridium homopropionicum DSM 5847 TaxID=1121318 RepID=A0A0L6ZBR7_9CLOT|nr:class I SAM-dependent methyltransferase [Clostridium homopropionicum]KOA20402.1 cyclopropane-fatty-acyl-phospholipid synthase [Clostridium homopropionicum DSM 5847]SFG75251.1 cyclopropane-fatty-acyl-phospholipid synthase [Clostridium homopropionicum]